jgi:hypothetical protein
MPNRTTMPSRTPNNQIVAVFDILLVGNTSSPGRDSVVDVEHLAEQLRNDLETAGVERAVAFKKKTTKRLRLRAHDLRGTFVTISLANDKTETWVMDRTGTGRAAW